MTVVILTAVPPGLRGHLTRWLLEISAGVFVGHISARVRELLWQRVIEYVDDGRALMVYTARNEQRLAFMVHGHDWQPVDYDGICLMRRQTAPDYIPAKRFRYTPAQDPADDAQQDSGIQSETIWKRRRPEKSSKPPETTAVTPPVEVNQPNSDAWSSDEPDQAAWSPRRRG